MANTTTARQVHYWECSCGSRGRLNADAARNEANARSHETRNSGHPAEHETATHSYRSRYFQGWEQS